MNRPEPDTPEARARAQSASEWLVRCDKGLSGAEQDAFLEWLAADPRHGEWLATHRRIVGDFQGLATWRPEHSEEPNPDLLAPTKRRPLRWTAACGLLAAAALVVVTFIFRESPTPADAPTATGGELRRRLLEDGSAVDLNRGAEVTTAFSDTERRAALVSGEAFFTVAKNPGRPFIVKAGAMEIRAIGTAFSVRLDAGTIDVLVTEGRVALAPSPQRPAAAKPAVAPPAAAEVSAGHRATVLRTGSAAPRIVAVTPQAIAHQLNWQGQLLDFSGAPLGVAIGEFNRRNRAQFVLADPDLAVVPIIASIRSDSVESFARFLESSPTIIVERRSDTEIVLHRRR